ncbi:MAG TPA: T9SS type A sorting domain-containing protein, partial [Chitinophagales bacterium]|nr:T9SS type A sorting domain-containing protein [Chitinophagales bacterium]
DAGYVTGDTIVCAGSTVVYVIDTVSGAAGYAWGYPNGWTVVSGQDSNSIQFTAGNSGGQVTVAAVNGCGQSLPALLQVNVHTPPIIDSISGPDTVCLAQDPLSIVFTAYGNNDVARYLWNVPGGWNIQGSDSLATLGVVADTSGYISVGAENSCGTGNTAGMYVVVNRTPFGIITESNNVLTAPTAASYQWYLNGQAISGANSLTYTPLQSGAYSVLVSSAEGCSYLTNAVSFTVNSINSLAQTDLRIYPNPAADLVVVEWNGRPATFAVKDICGRLVLKQNIQAQKTEISLNGLSSGLYLVCISNETGELRRELVIQ